MMSFAQFLKDVCEIPVGKITYMNAESRCIWIS